jgi:hypothetical protein
MIRVCSSTSSYPLARVFQLIPSGHGDRAHNHVMPFGSYDLTYFAESAVLSSSIST